MGRGERQGDRRKETFRRETCFSPLFFLNVALDAKASDQICTCVIKDTLEGFNEWLDPNMMK